MDSLLERAYNPDVLSCLANLSNDEVFTPPELANQVLDMLPPELWESPDTKNLDPCCSPGGRVGDEQPRLRREDGGADHGTLAGHRRPGRRGSTPYGEQDRVREELHGDP